MVSCNNVVISSDNTWVSLLIKSVAVSVIPYALSALGYMNIDMSNLTVHITHSKILHIYKKSTSSYLYTRQTQQEETVSGCLLLNVIISFSIGDNGLPDRNFSSLVSHYNTAFFSQSRLELYGLHSCEKDSGFC